MIWNRLLRAGRVASFLLCAASAEVSSQELAPPDPLPPPSLNGSPDRNARQEGKTEAPPAQRSVDPEPSKVQQTIRPAGELKEDYEAYKKPTLERRATRYNLLVSWYTLGLLLVAAGQAGLFVWQLKLIDRSTKDSERAATAAEASARLSREESISARPARVRVTQVNAWKTGSPKDVAPELTTGERITAQVFFIVSGTTAIIVDAVCMHAWLSTPLPMHRPYDDIYDAEDSATGAPARLAKIIRPPIDGPGLEFKPGQVGRWELELDVPTQPEAGKALYLLGHVYYMDELSNSRFTTYARRYDVAGRRFVAVENYPEYEGEH